MRKTIAHIAAVAAGTLALATLPGAANAAPTTDELVRDVTPAPASGIVLDSSESSNQHMRASSTSSNDGVSLELSNADGNAAVTVTLEESKPVESDENPSSPVARDSSGSPIYAQQLDAHQTRIITTIDDAQDNTSFRYDFALDDSQGIEVTADGIPFVYETDGDEISIVTMLSEPWAKDADGDSIDTSYIVDGEAIIQTVDTEGASFPIIADPTWTVGGARATVPSIRGGIADVYLNKQLTNDFVNGNNFACASAAAVLGLATGAIGGVAFGIACGASALAWSYNLNHDQCAVLTVRPGPPPTALGVPYRGSWCK